MKGQMVSGVIPGTGAALNVELGFIPDFLCIGNVTDGDHLQFYWHKKSAAFTSGGTHVIAAGDILQGATNVNVRARVEQVIVTSGSFAGGDAAGFLLWSANDENGTFGSENVDLLDDASTVEGGGGVETANVGAVSAQIEKGNMTPYVPALVTTTQAVSAYKGAAGSNARGFTIGSALSESTDMLFYSAWRGDRKTHTQ